MKEWDALVKTIQNSTKIVEVGVVGKYFESGKFTLMVTIPANFSPTAIGVTLDSGNRE